MTIGVLLIDDHAAVRKGLTLLIRNQGDIRVVGEAEDGREGVRQALRKEPDVVVMDIAMPVLDGIDATLLIRDRCPDTEVLILSVHADAEHVFRALRAGALGYLLKESAGNELADAVRCVHLGKRYLGTKISQGAIEDYLRQRHAASPLDSLNAREREVLRLLAAGKSSAEAAEILALPMRSVDCWCHRMMQRLGIADLPSLLAFARDQGVADCARQSAGRA